MFGENKAEGQAENGEGGFGAARNDVHKKVQGSDTLVSYRPNAVWSSRLRPVSLGGK